MDMDRHLSPNPTGRVVLHRRPERGYLSQVLEPDTQKISAVQIVQRLLGSILHGDRHGQAQICWKRDWADLSRRALEQHPPAANLPIRPQNLVLLKVRSNARTLSSPLCLQLQPVTQKLTLPRRVHSSSFIVYR